MKDLKELLSLSTKELLAHYRTERSHVLSGAFSITANEDEEDNINNVKNWINEQQEADKVLEHLKYLDDILTILGKREDLSDIMRREKLKTNLN